MVEEGGGVGETQLLPDDHQRLREDWLSHCDEEEQDAVQGFWGGDAEASLFTDDASLTLESLVGLSFDEPPVQCPTHGLGAEPV